MIFMLKIILIKVEKKLIPDNLRLLNCKKQFFREAGGYLNTIFVMNIIIAQQQLTPLCQFCFFGSYVLLEK